MKKFYTTLFAFVTLALSINAVKAQNLIYVDTAYTAQQMVTDFFGTTACVNVSNITFNGIIDSSTGNPYSIAFFDAANTNLGLNAGMLFCTGDAQGVANNSNTFLSGMTVGMGDPYLDQLAGGMGYDAAVIEFDLVPSTDTLCFKYVFASEEYNEYVGSNFNDVFGFFVTGPGIPGGGTNAAVVPNTINPVAVNNVNCMYNSQYYVCNDQQSSQAGGCQPWLCPMTNDSTDLAYDGFTTPLCAKLVLIPDSTYHVKLAIQDVGDMIFDSGIFLSIESLCGSSGLACHANFLPGFGQDSNDVAFDNNSIYGSSFYWEFGDGTTSNEKHPEHTYAQDGTYNVMLITCNFSACDTTYQTITIGSVSINQIELSDVVVFPNPALNTLNVRSVSGSAGVAKIYDAAGRLMNEQTLTGNALVDLSNWATGVYTVELLSDNKISRTRFHKQ